MKGSSGHMHIWVVCLLIMAVFGFCASSLTCEAAPIRVLPATEHACAEGALRFPVSSESRQYPELSLDRLHVTFATPSLMSPWGHTLTTDITVGRQRIHWGPGLTGGLVLSGHAPLDGLAFQVGLGQVSYTQVQAARDFESGKWLLAHRLEGRALPNLKLGISEAIAVSGGFRMQFAHLIPACPYYLIQHLAIKEDRKQDRWTNALVSVDASVDLRNGVLAYAEFMADDFPWAMSAKGRVPYMVGGLVGISLVKPLQSPAPEQVLLIREFGHEDAEPEMYYSVTAEYLRINNYVYSHKNPDNTYVTKNGTLIGHPLGPDTDGVYLILASDLNHRVGLVRAREASLCFGFERHGEGKLGKPWHPDDGIKHEFLSGIVETRKVLGLCVLADLQTVQDTRSSNEDIHLRRRDTYAWTEVQPEVTAELSLKTESIGNAGHILGARDIEGSIIVTLRLRYSPFDSRP